MRSAHSGGSHVTFHSIEQAHWLPKQRCDRGEDSASLSSAIRLAEQQLERTRQGLTHTRIRLDVLLREAERLRDDAQQLEGILNGDTNPLGHEGTEIPQSIPAYERRALRQYVEKTRGRMAMSTLIEQVEEERSFLELSVEMRTAVLEELRSQHRATGTVGC